MAIALSLSAGMRAEAAGPGVFMARQEPPVVAHADLATAGAPHGDMLVFPARFGTEGGATGTLNGLPVTVDIAEGRMDPLEEPIGQLLFDFGNGDPVLVAGQSVSPGTGHEVSAGAPRKRAIIGGTDTYRGARGQITTTRNTDASYEHMFELMD